MASTTEMDPSEEAKAFTSEQNRQRPLNSLVASGKRITAKTIKRLGGAAKSSEWQEDAWDMYDLVGEQRFLATSLAGRLGQARFFVGRLPERADEDIEPLNDGAAYDVFHAIEGQGHALSQMVTRCGVNLFVAGDGYIVGLPPDGGTSDDGQPQPASNAATGITPLGVAEHTDGIGDIDIDSLQWSMKSVSEISFDQSGNAKIEGDEGKSRTYNADDIILIRVWRPHPRRWWAADSPTRSSLPVLRELVGLTMHVSAQVDSRLAGAGMFLIPESADRAIRAAAGIEPDSDDLSPFVEAVMEAMTTAISDRSNASALVPIMPVVPDESIEKFRYISFAGTLDTEARALRDEAIRRLALGQDCPPELLLGVGGMNHWGAWLVREDVVTTHIEPPLALICDAITTQFLWPVLEQQGIEDYEQYVVWYDVSHMIMRPNRADDAKALHAVGALSDESLRAASGFDESDAPSIDAVLDPAVALVMDMVRSAPSLVQNPGLAVLVDQVKAMLTHAEIPDLPDGQPTPAEGEEGPSPEEDTSTEGDLPDTADDPAEPPSMAASAAAATAEQDEVRRVTGHIVNQIVTGEYGPTPPGPPPAPRMIPLTHGGGSNG